MKMLKVVILLAMIGVLFWTAWTVSASVKAHQLNDLIVVGKIPYGPITDSEKDYYSYRGLAAISNTHRDLKRVDLRRVEEFTKSEFQHLILESLPPADQENLKRYLSSILHCAEDYQVDPFWIISVMMVESSFNKTAKSSKNASGLMQIKMDTAGYLYQLMNKKISEEQIQRNLYYPEQNIEVGVFYLKELLQNFKFNYSHATIAYNVGPYKLKSLLNRDDIEVSKNAYFIKIQDCYSELSKNFVEAIHERPHALASAAVSKSQKRI